MTNLFYSNFDTVFDSMLNWDNDTRSISTPTSYIKDVDVKVEDRFLLIKAEKDNRKLERKYKIHESFDLNSTSAICKDGLLNIEIPKYEDRKAKNITVKVK